MPSAVATAHTDVEHDELSRGLSGELCLDRDTVGCENTNTAGCENTRWGSREGGRVPSSVATAHTEHVTPTHPRWGSREGGRVPSAVATAHTEHVNTVGCENT